MPRRKLTDMKRDIKRILQLVIVFGLLRFSGGCTTTELSPPEVPNPPSYMQVPHPEGMDLGDLTRVLLDEKAPKDPEFGKTCDQAFSTVKKLVKSKAELEEGVLELVIEEPVHYHWCFYSKLNWIENEMRGDKYIDEKQKLLIQGFEFLVPVAKAFQREFKDSRYLRWAVFRYKKNSELVFYRKLDLTPAGTMELVQPTNPFGLWRKDTPAEVSVLEKYHFRRSPDQAQGQQSFQSPVPTAPILVGDAAGSPMPSPAPVASQVLDPIPVAPQATGSVTPEIATPSGEPLAPGFTLPPNPGFPETSANAGTESPPLTVPSLDAPVPMPTGAAPVPAPAPVSIPVAQQPVSGSLGK